jgi:hypothetical protein
MLSSASNAFIGVGQTLPAHDSVLVGATLEIGLSGGEEVEEGAAEHLHSI